MLGALVKSYYAREIGVDPANMFVVSVMPCTAKKYECGREEMSAHPGIPDVDAVLTTREAAKMIREMGLDFANLQDEEFDEPLGISTGAGVIFGATGGVMEAALRTAYCLITGEPQPPAINFESVRGMEGVKEAEIDIKGTKVRIAVAHQMGNIEQVLNAVREDRKAGRKPRYDFIEVMACRGGCIGGGGQPWGTNQQAVRTRMQALYQIDSSEAVRTSHSNPSVQRLYQEFLGQPLSEQSHHLLHTHYEPRETLV